MTDTNWLEKLKTKYPAMTLSADTPDTTRHPRDVVIELLDTSLAVLADPAHTIQRRGKPQKPETCFTLRGAEAEVTLRYSRTKVTLPDGNKVMTVPKADLPSLLVDLKTIVAEKVFDAELQSIKASRVAAMKKSAKADGTQKKAA
jgi:hypothetical protein